MFGMDEARRRRRGGASRLWRSNECTCSIATSIKVHKHSSCPICTGIGARMSHRKWRETKHNPSRTSSGHLISCFLFSLHFRYNILAPIPVVPRYFENEMDKQTQLVYLHFHLHYRLAHAHPLVRPIFLFFSMRNARACFGSRLLQYRPTSRGIFQKNIQQNIMNGEMCKDYRV